MQCSSFEKVNELKTKVIHTISEEATSGLAGFHACPISSELEFKDSGARTITNSTHVWHRAGIEPDCGLLTAPSSVPRNSDSRVYFPNN